MSERLSVLVLAPFDGTDADAVRDFLFSFNAYSRHRYRYIFDCGVLDDRFDYSAFDVILVFWTLDVLSPALSDEVRARIARTRALKVLFRQDDYRDVRATAAAMRGLGIQLVLTCVDEADHATFYSREQIPTLEACETVLPGYVPEYLRRYAASAGSARPIDVGYRSRAMPFYLGDVGHAKSLIADRFQAVALRYDLRCDISVREEDRLYGRRWLAFLESCRCVLGTPSGSSVADLTGEIRRNCERYLGLNPRASYDELKARFFADVEGRVVIDTVSPRIFEAAALRCTMVNQEGRYGGILEPDRHYIAVKRDYSNIPDVVDRIKDRTFCRELADKAHSDLIASRRYSYAAFVRRFDDVLTRHGRAAGSPAPWMRFYGRNYVRHGQAIIPLRTSFVLAPSRQLAFELTRRALARLPRRRRGPMLSRLIQNPTNFALKAATTWAVTLGVAPLRALLVTYLMTQPSERVATVFALLDDLRKLDIIRRARRGALRARQPFDVSGALDVASETLLLTSVAAAADARWSELPEQPDRVATLVWDHSALGHQVVYRLGRRRWLTASIGPGGVHRFDAVNQLLRLRPAAVWPVVLRLLQPPMATRPGDGSARVMESSAR